MPKLRQAEREHPEGTRIFNEFLYGGFLIYYTPGLKVFIDDRCELYGDEWLVEYSNAMRLNPRRIDHWLGMYNFPYALVARGSAFDRYLGQTSGWVVVKTTDVAMLYKRSVPKNAAAETVRGAARGVGSEADTPHVLSRASRGNANESP